MAPSRLQKRWSARFRTLGALLVLLGVIALVDRVLPGSRDPLLTLPAPTQLILAGCALVIGATLFVLGRRWR
jgi:hypothetical protein